MAISTNLLLKNLRGRIGKELVVRQYGEKTVISKYPDMNNRVLSPKQVEVTENMAKANYAAKGILRDEKLRTEAQVRLNVTRNRLYPALVKEYFKNLREAEAKKNAAG
jgi:hypothetical protein